MLRKQRKRASTNDLRTAAVFIEQAIRVIEKYEEVSGGKEGGGRAWPFDQASVVDMEKILVCFQAERARGRQVITNPNYFLEKVGSRSGRISFRD